MCAYPHILDTRTRFMYNVCIHFEIHHAQVRVHGHVGHWMLGWPEGRKDWLGKEHKPFPRRIYPF